MKKITSVLLASIAGAITANAQCSQTLNNYEIKLSQVGDQSLKVQVRFHEGAVQGAEAMPTNNIKLDGLVFAISWPKSSDVKLTKCTPSNGVFDIAFDNSIPSGQSNKTATPKDNIQTLFHNNTESMPIAFGNTWQADKWVDLAVVNFSGKLNKGDYFSLVTCDYGLANPNSYYGNSTTDPWFATLDESGNYHQYSPKMITEIPTGFANNVEVYPVPTTGELHVDVECTASTNAVVKVLDRSGRLVKTVLFGLEKGKNANTIDIGELASGEYLIQITDGKALNFTKKVSKL
jgi:hypothetical protein